MAKAGRRTIRSRSPRTDLVAAGLGAGKAKTCEDAWRELVKLFDAGDKDDLRKAEVKSLKLSGDRATVHYSGEAKGDCPSGGTG